MAEMMAKSHAPDPLLEAYKKWSKGNWGSILTGNVQVDINHLGSPFDPALSNLWTSSSSSSSSSDESAVLTSWRKYATACQEHGTPALAQICHPGRQSFRVAGKRGIFASTIAPSAVPISVGNSWLECIIGAIAWTKPRALETDEVYGVIERFVSMARLMADAGFSGIELHGAHGYLIGMFMTMKQRKED